MNTLYEHYKSKGETLPTWQERAPIYESQGLGVASSYTGTAEQNTALLGKLQTTPVAPTVPPVTDVPPPPTGGTTDIDIDPSIETDSDVFSGAPKTQADVDSQIAKNVKLQDEYLLSLEESQGVKDTKQKLADMRNRAQEGIQDIKDQAIPMKFITGQAKSVEARAGIEEDRLLTRLGLEQDAQKLKSDIAGKKYDFALDNQELAVEAEARINEQKQNVLDQARLLSNDSRNRLADILDMFPDGIDTNNLTSEDKAELERMAIASGFKADLIFKGLDNMYDESELKRIQDTKGEEDKNSTSLTSEDKRTLIGVNLSDKMISNIEEGVRTVGMEKVLEDGYTDAQKTAIKEVYGQETKEITNAQLTQLSRVMDTDDIENFFTARFSKDEITKMAKAAGFASGWDFAPTERKKFYASVETRKKIVEIKGKEYEDAGYTIK